MGKTTLFPLVSPEHISTQWLEEMLANDLGHSVKFIEWTSTSPESSNGYLSEMSFVKVLYTSGGETDVEKGTCPATKEKDEKSVSLVVKCMTKDPDILKLIRKLHLGRREVEFYKYSKSEEFITSCNTNRASHPVPKAFWAGMKDETVTIVLQDLRTMNFREMKTSEGNTLEQLKCTLRSIAIVHAAGLATLHWHGKDILNIPLDGTYLINSITHGLNLQIKMFAGSRIAATLEAILSRVTDLINVHSRYPFLNTLIHGDLWTGNVMMNEDEGLASIIDWQFARIGNPVCDIMTLLFLSGKPSAYQQHFTQLLECYWHSFEEAMKKNNTPVKRTFEQLKRNAENMCIYGYMVATSVPEYFMAKNEYTYTRIKNITIFMHEQGHLEKFLTYK